MESRYRSELGSWAGDLVESHCSSSTIQGVAWSPSPPFHTTLPGSVLLNQNRRKARDYGKEPRPGGRGGRRRLWPVHRNGPCLMMTCDSAVIPAIVGTTAILLSEDRAISRFPDLLGPPLPACVTNLHPCLRQCSSHPGFPPDLRTRAQGFY